MELETWFLKVNTRESLDRGVYMSSPFDKYVRVLQVGYVCDPLGDNASQNTSY